ncbi:MAG: hypothetical protein HDR46_05010 [Bacteroides sp.]|nr:hypothetical protein [Bacteroides sp.]
MANSKLIYKFTDAPVGRKNPKGLWVQCGIKGQSSGRVPFPIDELKTANLEHWNSKAQRFEGRLTSSDVANNDILDELAKLCDKLLSNPKITTPSEFIDVLKTGKEPNAVTTFGGFLQSKIDEMRNGTNNRLPSRNYQIYINLLHKLEREGEIINVPLADIADKHFRQFANFILSLPAAEGRNNYNALCCRFKAVWRSAFENEENNNLLHFKYSDHAPVTEAAPPHSLTLEQYRKFIELDLDTIPSSGVNQSFYKELYRDVCIWLYEVSTRPVDFIRAHSSQIVEDRGAKCYRYVPEKKKNGKKGRVEYTTAPLSPTALAIIEKYKGQSSKGYIFPFSMNEYDWDFADAKSWNKWNNRKNRTEERIRVFLRKVGEALGLDFPLIIYTFRHSALTHKVNKGENIAYIAKCAGTSIDTLEKHYYDHTTQFAM